MLRQFQTLIDDILGAAQAATLDEEEVPIACAALLVHCAKADGHRSSEEDAKLRELLAAHYGLSSGDTQALIDEAERREAQASDVHRFTRVLHEALDRDGRLAVVRLLWEISHADNSIDHDERTIVNLVASLLHVELADVVALRRHVAGRGSP